MFFVYVLESIANKSFYIGYTENLEERIVEHNASIGKYTSHGKPWKIVYIEEYTTKHEAISREKYLKRLKSRSYIRRLIDNMGL